MASFEDSVRWAYIRKEANDQMKISKRRPKRPEHVVAPDGSRELLHGDTGRRPGNAINLAVKQEIAELSRTQYGSFDDTPFTEKLATDEGIRISREPVRKICRESGISPKGCRRPPGLDPIGLRGSGGHDGPVGWFCSSASRALR